MENNNEPLRKAYAKSVVFFGLLYISKVYTRKCTLTSRSECTKSNETLKETFRLQSYKTFL